MGSGNSVFEITVANATRQPLYAFKGIDKVPFDAFRPGFGREWYHEVRGCLRIAPGNCVTFRFDVPNGTRAVYISIATEAGKHIADCYEKPARDGGIIVTMEGSVIKSRPKFPWKGDDGNDHQPPTLPDQFSLSSCPSSHELNDKLLVSRCA